MKTVCFVNPRLPKIVVAKASKIPTVEGSSKYCFVQWRRQLNKWGAIFIYSCSAQLISFEIDSISKKINCAEHEYINMSPPLIELAMPLVL